MGYDAAAESDPKGEVYLVNIVSRTYTHKADERSGLNRFA